MERLRMCVVCRQMHDKKQLLRVVKNKEGEVFIDNSGKMNGRGAYICKNKECVDKLLKQKALNKAFKINVEDEVYQRIREAILGD